MIESCKGDINNSLKKYGKTQTNRKKLLQRKQQQLQKSLKEVQGNEINKTFQVLKVEVNTIKKAQMEEPWRWTI